MRTITTTVYSYEELSDSAKTVAVEQLQGRLAGPWWDSHDTDAIAEVMVYTLAEMFRTPGWDTYGCADFPGIPAVKLDAWDLDQRRYLALRGHLDRDNAPELPWMDGIHSVTLTAEWHNTRADVVDSDDDSDPTDDQRAAITEAITDAIHAALRAGEVELEYKTSTEYAREIAANYEYTDDGHLYP
jgi:hypothetical protein